MGNSINLPAHGTSIVIDDTDLIATSLLDSFANGANIVLSSVTIGGDKKIRISTTGVPTGSGTTNTYALWTGASVLGDGNLTHDAVNGHVEIAAGKAFRDATLTTNVLYLDDGFNGITLSIDGLNYLNSYLGMWDHSIELKAGTSDGAATTLWLQAMQQSGTVVNSINIHSDEGTPANSLNTHISETKHLFRIGANEIVFIDANGLTVNGVNGIDFVPGSDVNVDLFTIGVTGTPKLYWRETPHQLAFNTSTHANFAIVSGNNNDAILSYYESSTEKAVTMYDGGLECYRLQLPGGTDIERVYPDGEFKIYNRGEADPAVAADTFSHFGTDAAAVAGRCSPHWKTEDGTILVLATTSLMTNLTLSGSLLLGATTAVSGILDEDDLTSNSATDLATQQSIKSYVDSSVNVIINFFFNDTASDIGGIYYDQTNNDLGGGESTLSIAGLSAATNDQALVNFATLANEPGVLSVPAGIFNVHFHAERTAGSSDVNIYAEIYKRASGGTETLITTTEISGLVTSKASFNLHASASVDTDLLVTDRIVIKFFANLGSGSGATVAIYQEGTTTSHLSVPSTVDALSQIFIRQDGTKAMTGDFNLDGNNIDNGGVIFLKEQASPDGDVAGSGQIWVKTATPNQLWFTDDGSNDREIVYAGGAYHDGLSDFVANEHIDHTSVTLTAGSGLAGSGDISANRTFDLDINSLSVATIAAGDFVPFWDITATATNKKITFANLEATLSHDALADFAAGEHFLQSAITEVGTVVTGDVTAVVSAATQALAGKIEIATTAEINSSTASLAMTPDQFAASNAGRAKVGVVLFGTETAVTELAVGTDDLPLFVVPAELNGWELIEVIVGVYDKGVTGTTDVNVNRRRAGANVAMLSTDVTLADEWFASDGVINAANDDLATGDTLSPYVTGIHSGTAPNGLTITYIFQQP